MNIGILGTFLQVKLILKGMFHAKLLVAVIILYKMLNVSILN